jgi:hypothetical protein
MDTKWEIFISSSVLVGFGVAAHPIRELSRSVAVIADIPRLRDLVILALQYFDLGISPIGVDFALLVFLRIVPNQSDAGQDAEHDSEAGSDLLEQFVVE